MDIVFVNKNKNEKTINNSGFEIVKVVKKLIESANCQVCGVSLLVSPGYLSTKECSIKKFISYFFDKGISYNLGILDGMNGGNGLNNKNIRYKFFDEFLSQNNTNSVMYFTPQYYGLVTNPDHRKMVFVMSNCICDIQMNGIKHISNQERVLDHIDRFVEDQKIYGVLLGSSNFSLGTYYGMDRKGKRVADKGESDCLLFDRSIAGGFYEYMDKEVSRLDENYNPAEYTAEENYPVFRPGSILLAHVSGGYGKSCQDYFKNMLRITLNAQIN